MKNVKDVQPPKGQKHGTNGNGTVVVSKAPAPFTRRPGGKNLAAIDASAKPTSRLAPRIAGIGSAVITITPAMAERYLEGKLPNRNLKEPDIERYIRDIKAGAWHLNGESMIFSGNEDAVRNGWAQAGLLDGQQRSWAIVLSGTPIQTLVSWGVPPESMESIDTGAKRSFGDVLTIKGRKNSASMAGAARWMWWYDNAFDTVRSGAVAVKPTHNELAVTVEKHPYLEEASAIAMASKARTFISPSISAFVVTGAIEVGLRAEAIQFMDVLGKGMDPSREWGTTHPVYHLYQRFQSQRNNAKEKKTPSLVACALMLKAFNSYAAGEEMRSLKWNYLSSEKPEPFPRFEKIAKTARKAARKAVSV